MTIKTSSLFSRRDFIRVLKEFFISLITLGSGSLIYTFLVEPGWLDVEDIEIPVQGLPGSFSGFRIVQISDIHMGGWMDRARLRKALDVVRAQMADLAVITGDFVFGYSWGGSLNVAAGDFVSEMESLTAEFPTLGVLGNHDHWTDAGNVRVMLARSGITELNNDVHTIRRGEDQLHIAGVDDVWEAKARLDEVMGKLPDSGAAILLAHEPDFADDSSKKGRFCLQLSGHTHGGQVVLPFVGPPVLPHLGRRYPSGLYKVREMWQYTNRGVGMIEPAVRFNCRPEITVITLKSV